MNWVSILLAFRINFTFGQGGLHSHHKYCCEVKPANWTRQGAATPSTIIAVVSCFFHLCFHRVTTDKSLVSDKLALFVQHRLLPVNSSIYLFVYTSLHNMHIAALFFVFLLYFTPFVWYYTIFSSSISQPLYDNEGVTLMSADVDLDGHPDLLVGSPLSPGPAGPQSGKVCIMLSSKNFNFTTKKCIRAPGVSTEPVTYILKLFSLMRASSWQVMYNKMDLKTYLTLMFANDFQ